MECLWCLFCHWQPDGHRYQPDQAVLYLHLAADDGLPDYYLPRAGFLEKYAELRAGGEEESLVQFVGIITAPFQD